MSRCLVTFDATPMNATYSVEHPNNVGEAQCRGIVPQSLSADHELDERKWLPPAACGQVKSLLTRAQKRRMQRQESMRKLKLIAVARIAPPCLVQGSPAQVHLQPPT